MITHTCVSYIYVGLDYPSIHDALSAPLDTLMKNNFIQIIGFSQWYRQMVRGILVLVVEIVSLEFWFQRSLINWASNNGLEIRTDKM